MPEDESTGSRSVRRALDIFELMLQSAEPITVAQIVTELSIPKSTAYELVRTLSEGDYLAPSGRGSGLFLGRKLFELGMAYRGHVDLLKDGSRIAEQLRDETGETVQLSVLDNDLMMVLLKEEGVRAAAHHQPGRLARSGELGGGRPAAGVRPGRQGACRAADGDDPPVADRPRDHRCEEADRADPEVPQAGLCHRAQRDQRACRLRRRAGHRRVGPLRRRAFSVVAPEQRLAKPNRDYLIERVMNAAEKLSRRLG